MFIDNKSDVITLINSSRNIFHQRHKCHEKNRQFDLRLELSKSHNKKGKKWLAKTYQLDKFLIAD